MAFLVHKVLLPSKSQVFWYCHRIRGLQVANLAFDFIMADTAAPTGVEAHPGLEKAVSRNSRKASVGPVVVDGEVLAGEADAELLGKSTATLVFQF